MHAALVSALEETVRLVQLTEDLLLLARTDRCQDASSTEVPTIPHLQGVPQRAVSRLAGGAPDKTVTVDGPTDFTVTIPEDRLERALTNLIHNAQQHGDGSHPTGPA